MNGNRHTTSSTLRDDYTESTETSYSPMGVNSEGSSDTKPLPPKSLKRYTTRQLRKKHTVPWIVFTTISIVATLLAASQLANGDSGSDGCNIGSHNSRTEQRLSFTKAKFIDLLWDTVIGQGGRFIHGIVLHQLVSRALTLLLERSTLPYIFFLGVKFSTVSIESLWVCFCVLFSKAPIRTTAMVVSLLFVIGHVLAFATIWSATTGYEADTVAAYDILGSGAFLKKDSDRLTTCWSVEDLNRVDPSLTKPIIGPKFVQAYENWGHIGDKKEFERLQMRVAGPIGEVSEAFKDIYAYALAKETFFGRYNTTDFTPLRQINGTHTWFDDDCYNNGAETENGYKFAGTRECTSRLLYTSIDGWQYAGSGQKGIENLPSDTRNKTLDDPSHGKLGDSEYVPYNATFLLDSEIKTAQGVLPYNSTLWWNNTRIALGAPFLKIGESCQWSRGSLGLCLCLDEDIISKDFRDSDYICLNDTGYKWGFSAFVLLIGLALETAWLVVCTMMWFVIITKSELVRMHRPGIGVIRSILDIAGAINSSIGIDTSAYTEDELKLELGKCPPVGYEIDDRDGIGYKRIRLRAMPKGIMTKRHLRVNKNALYG
ncbi:hypothetical protein F5Y10DRAFT_285009 [Nemania abortiva]|nr:hypothetical protein F5Y10DRAFT_285009 [Nemania abortiva]